MRNNVLILTLFLLLVQASAQSQVLTLREYRENNETVKLDPAINRFEVDINSYIDVEIHPENFKLPAAERADFTASAAATGEDVENIRAFTEQFVNEYKAVTAEISSLVAGTEGVRSAAQRQKLMQLAARHGNLQIQLDEAIVNAYGEDFAEALGESVGMDATEMTYIDLQVDALKKYVEDTRLELEKNIKENIAGAGEFTFKAWCMHEGTDKSPSPIHLPNYDNLAAGALSPLDKLAFSRTPEEDALLRQQIEQYNQLRNAIQDLKDLDNDISETVKNLKNELGNDLKDLRSMFGTADLLEAYDEIIRATANAEPTQELLQLKNDLQEFRNGFQQFIRLKDDHERLIAGLEATTEPDPMVLFNMLDQAFIQKKGEIIQLGNQVQDLVSPEKLLEIQNNLNRIRETFEENAAGYSVQVQQKVRNFLDSKAAKWMATFGDVSKVLSKYEAFYGIVDPLANMLKTNSTASSLGSTTGNFAPKQSFTVPVSEAGPTTIEIPRTKRQDGDIYTLHIQVLENDKPVQNYTWSFRTRTYGFYRRWTAGLNFILHDGEKSFVPATSASYVLHYRSFPKWTGSNWEKGKGIFGDLLNVGFGINSAVIPDFQDNTQIQFGLGASLTFFNDFLHVGGGYNLQRKEDRGYFFITAAVLELFGNRYRN